MTAIKDYIKQGKLMSCLADTDVEPPSRIKNLRQTLQKMKKPQNTKQNKKKTKKKKLKKTK